MIIVTSRRGARCRWGKPIVQVSCTRDECAEIIATFHAMGYFAIAIPATSFLPASADVERHNGRIF
jgi:hypothetical protein